MGPAFWVAVCGLAALAGGLAFVPLFDLLGYEFSAAVSLLASALVGPAAIGVVRRSPALPALRLWLRAALAGLAALLPPLLIILLNGLRVTNCNPGEGLLLYLLLPVATAVVTSGWGTALALLVGRRWLAGLAYAGLWLAVAAASGLQVWSGPEVDSYNQLVGWVAGPIYDDVIEPGWPLVLCRLQGLAAAAALVLAAGLLRRADERRLVNLAGLAASAALAGGLWLGGDRLGFGRSEDAVRDRLAATTTSRHFVIRHRPELSRTRANLLARDCEFRLHQIESLLGRRRLPPLQAWVFSSADRKRALVGAGRTQYAKPWQFAMFLNGTGFPHPTLKHELVHVFAGAFATPPFGVSAAGPLSINPGLTEGLAVAVDWPAGRFDVHTWSAALRRIDRAPPIRDLFGPLGFWRAAAGRSYASAGSFVRFLLHRYGPKALVAAYRDGRLAGHYPADVDALIADWQRFLDQRPLDPGTLEVARLRFARQSVFQRTCAHEVAALRRRAARRLAKGDLTAAEDAVAQLLEHLPADPRAREMLIEIRLAQDRPADAAAIAEKLLAREDLGRAAKARLAGRMGDVMRRLDRPQRARALQRRLLDAHLSDATDRLALVKLQCLERGAPARPVLAFLELGRADALTLLQLHQVAVAEPGWGAAWYLLGRQLFNRGEFERAIRPLWSAARRGLGHPSLIAENLRLLAISLFRAGGPREPDPERPPAPLRARAQAAALLAVVAEFPRHRGELLTARDWLQRLRFERNHTLEVEIEGLDSGKH